ncbi:hypothetical protein [Isoptericola aurantiacus]|uniref:hypothetical protein n=1 Tax=Isoptericola aurantiacus TaxID=3377839 RepID=UPI00383BA7A9
MRNIAAVVLLTSAVTFGAVAAELDLDSYTDDDTDSVQVGAVGNGSSPATDGSDGPQDRYFRADTATCNVAGLDEGFDLTTAAGACDEDAFTITIDGAPCGDDEVELPALWVQRVQPDGTYADAELVSARDCISPADVAAEAQQAFAAMQVPTPEATVQAREPLLVNVHYPARATAAPVTQQVILLGVPVEIRADPVEYTWDFDDPYSAGGGTLTTTDQGRAWQAGDGTPDDGWVGHTYTALGNPDQDQGTHRDAEGDWYRDDVTVTVTTTWRGSFRLAGAGAWTEIDGTITTTSALDPVTVTEARTRLVCDDLAGSSSC